MSSSRRIAAVAGALASAALVVLVVAPGGASAGGSRSCRTVSIGHGNAVSVSALKGRVSCATARSIAGSYDHPKALRSSCHPSAHACEYGVYAEGWRCTGLFQGNFGCWLGGDAKGRGARASFAGMIVSDGSSGAAGEAGGPTASRLACTRRALTKGLRRGGLRGYIDGHTFGCAGRFAYAGVIVDGNEVTVLFRARGRGWHPADRSRYCVNGSVPKAIYRPACETN
jgi:hypothetical protein